MNLSHVGKHASSIYRAYCRSPKVAVDTVKHLLQQMELNIATRFANQEVAEEMQNSVKYVVAHVLGRKTLHGIPDNTKLTPEQTAYIHDLANQCFVHKPVQYVIGYWDFRNLELLMKPPVLIPRPETEELVGHILRDPTTTEASSFLEVGCGSGAISLSLLDENHKLIGHAIDKSPDACSLTETNASRCKLAGRLKIYNSPIEDHESRTETGLIYIDKVDFIVSNPPYIPEDQIATLMPEVRLYEDHGALKGGQDGLDVIKSILHSAHLFVKDKGYIWLEVDSSHPPLIEQYIQHNCKHISLIKVIQDFRDMPRFCHLQVHLSHIRNS